MRKLDDGFPSDVGAGSEPQHAVRIGMSHRRQKGVVWCGVQRIRLCSLTEAARGREMGWATKQNYGQVGGWVMGGMEPKDRIRVERLTQFRSKGGRARQQLSISLRNLGVLCAWLACR